MKTKKGAYRLVLFGKKYVYKFASLRYFWGVWKNIPRMLMHGDGKFIFREMAWGWRNFTRGIQENLSEFKCWKRMRKQFLVPTILSLGIINIQERAIGDQPTPEELQNLFGKLPLIAQEELKKFRGSLLRGWELYKNQSRYLFGRLR